MKTLTIILIISFVTFHLSSVGQRKSDLSDYNISSLNANVYLDTVQRLIDIDNRDSLFKAYQILRKLHYFDSVKYSGSTLKPYYLKIETINLNNIESNLVGIWKFEWSGSNWGTNKTFKDKNETIIFTNDSVSFYRGDTLLRKTLYSITNKFSILLKEFNFQVYYHDDKTNDRISLRTDGADYAAHLKYSSKNVGLYFEAGEFCNDCGYSIFVKQPADNYRMQQERTPNTCLLP